MSSMSCARRLAPFLALALLAVTASALRDEQLRVDQNAGGRKLMQPFTLGIPSAGRRSGNTGKTGERRTNGLSFATANLIDTSRNINKTIRATTTQRPQATNLNLGGVTKTTFTANGTTSATGGSTITGTDVKSIGAPLFGLTASKSIDQSSILSSVRTRPAAQPSQANAVDRFTGPNNNVFAGAFDVLAAATADYGFAGDYDYAIINTIVDQGVNVATRAEYDYDYGTVRPIPETGSVTTRTATTLNDTNGRAASFGRMATATTAPNAVARGSVITSGLFGSNSATFKQDIVGNGTTFIPPNQYRQVGASSAAAGLAKGFKGNPLPSAVANTQTAGSVVSRNYVVGGAADQLSVGHGTQSVALKSQNVALSGAENVDFDVAAGRRRRLQGARRRGHGRRHGHRAHHAQGNH